MTTVPVPTRTAGDIGAALSNTRTPAANELSAVNLEKIKDHLIDHANAINANADLTPIDVANSSTEAISIRSLDDNITKLKLYPYGVGGVGGLSIQPDPQTTPTLPGWTTIVTAGNGGASNQAGGVVEIDGGDGGGTGADGQIKIGTKRGDILSGPTGGVIWAHRGDLSVTNAPTATNHVTRKDYVDAQRATVATLAGTSANAADADSGKLIRCTAGTTVTITVPTGLTPGTTIEYLQEGAGQVQIVAGGGLTLRHAAAFNPHTAQQWSSVVITILDTDECLVRGDLAPV